MIVALIVMITVSSPGTTPFHVTVLVPVFATAVPEVAKADVRVNCAGSTSTNSFPGLSC